MGTGGAACLTCKRRFGAWRGCCHSCYQRHWLAIKKGQATWEKLAAAGLVRAAETKDERVRRSRQGRQGGTDAS